ncbi:MAG TPA: ferrochelatase [Vicinamibacteria bacterium]|nr:ferrochelatase [Vicinamibacteria bacterium]
MSSSGVLLLAHGTPETLDQMPEYLTLVRGGRPPSPELVEEMRRNYGAIGGRSPLTEVTRAQADALARALGDGTPVFVGMRNWRPFIADALREALAAGVAEVVALPMAPQYSTLSVAKYRAATEAARPDGLVLRFVEPWHDHPGLLDAFAEKVKEALLRSPADAVVFTAHSLPRRVIDAGDPYPDEVSATARGVALRAGLDDFRLAWQSAGRTNEPWLGPTLEEELRTLAAVGARRVLVAPIGFVADHTEVLFDIDVQAREAARALGIRLQRTASLNDSPRFIATLADLVRRARGPGAPAV